MVKFIVRNYDKNRNITILVELMVIKLISFGNWRGNFRYICHSKRTIMSLDSRDPVSY